jgi:hypothetical protein
MVLHTVMALLFVLAAGLLSFRDIAGTQTREASAWRDAMPRYVLCLAGIAIGAGLAYLELQGRGGGFLGQTGTFVSVFLCALGALIIAVTFGLGGDDMVNHVFTRGTREWHFFRGVMFAFLIVGGLEFLLFLGRAFLEVSQGRFAGAA